MSNENQPAFPVFLQEGLSYNSHVDAGVSKREYFAGLAMQGLLASGRTDNVEQAAVLFADHLLKELENSK